MRAKKFFGQHFLRDASVVEAIIEALELTGLENVLEIGPGEGVLTEQLVQKAHKVVAVDIDPEAVATTKERVPAPNLSVREQNVLRLSIADVDGFFNAEPWLLVGNLPYNITSDLMKWMLAEGGPRRMVIMIQREVADRMMAGKGDMNMLALFVRLHASVRRVAKVPPGSFAPPPKVDSAVVCLDREDQHHRAELGVQNPEQFLRFANVAFAQKRKQLKSTLGNLPQVDVGMLKNVLIKQGYTETARPQELSFDDWILLFHKVHGYC